MHNFFAIKTHFIYIAHRKSQTTFVSLVVILTARILFKLIRVFINGVVCQMHKQII